MMRSKDRGGGGGGRSGYDRYEDDYDYRRRARSYSRSPRRCVVISCHLILVLWYTHGLGNAFEESLSDDCW